MNGYKEQLRMWETKRSEINMQYRSARMTFIYYLIGIAIAILGYLINTIKPNYFEQNLYKIVLTFFVLCIVFGFTTIILDYQMKFNDYARGEFLIKQNQTMFDRYVANYIVLDRIEFWTHILTILTLILGLLFCLLWRLFELNIL